MQRVFTHIERLLLTNDCVIIPEFGGFVIHPCPAVYQPEKHKFCPPSKGIVFNPNVNHHDRLLLDSYMQMYGISFEEARMMLKGDIKELYHTIDKEGAVHFEKTGLLKRGDDWNLCFEPDKDLSLIGLKPFGLYPFHLPPVAHDTQIVKTETAQTIQLETRQKRVIHLPVSRALLRVAGVSAAAVALFLLISTPVNDVGTSSYSACLIPSEMILSNVCVSDTPNDTTQEPVLEAETIEYTAISEETPPSPVVQAAPPIVKITETTSQKIYYAIIGSFTSEKQANQFIQQINMPELTNMGIVTNEERVRVYAEKFDNRGDAQNYILRLRANAKLKDTWLFVGQ